MLQSTRHSRQGMSGGSIENLQFWELFYDLDNDGRSSEQISSGQSSRSAKLAGLN